MTAIYFFVSCFYSSVCSGRKLHLICLNLAINFRRGMQIGIDGAFPRKNLVSERDTSRNKISANESGETKE